MIRRGRGKGRNTHNGWLEKQTRNGKWTKYDKTDRWWTQYCSQFYTIKLSIFLTVKDNRLVSMPYLMCICITLWLLSFTFAVIWKTLLRDYPSFTNVSFSSSLLINLDIKYFQSIWCRNSFYKKKENRGSEISVKKCVILYAKWLGVYLVNCQVSINLFTNF